MLCIKLLDVGINRRRAIYYYVVHECARSHSLIFSRRPCDGTVKSIHLGILRLGRLQYQIVAKLCSGNRWNFGCRFGRPIWDYTQSGFSKSCLVRLWASLEILAGGGMDFLRYRYKCIFLGGISESGKKQRVLWIPSYLLECRHLKFFTPPSLKKHVQKYPFFQIFFECLKNLLKKNLSTEQIYFLI